MNKFFLPFKSSGTDHKRAAITSRLFFLKYGRSPPTAIVSRCQPEWVAAVSWL